MDKFTLNTEELHLPQPDPIPDHCIFKYSEDNLIRQDDLAIFWESSELQKQTVMAHGGAYQTKDGKYFFKHIINKEQFGSKVFSQNMRSYIVVVRPNTYMYTESLT